MFIDSNVKPDNLLVCILSMGIYLLLMENQYMKVLGTNCIIEKIAELSFGIYLIHPIFLNFINKALKIYPNVLPVIIGEMVFWIIAFAGSFCVCSVYYNINRRIVNFITQRSEPTQ